MARDPSPGPAGQRAAQQRADRIRAFREELAELDRAGILQLEPEQRDKLDRHLDDTLAALAARFDVDISESQKRMSWGMRIASTLGGAALCAAVVLFFQRFWGALGIPAQVAALVAAPLLLLAATHFAARRDRSLYFASLLSIVAFGAFVMNLSVLAETFQLTPSPAALLAFGIFGLLLAYQYGLRLPLAAGLFCLGAWLSAVLFAWSGYHWASFLERPECLLPAALLLLLIPSAPRHRRYEEFNRIYRAIGLLVFFIAILALSELGGTSYLFLASVRVEILYQAAGFASAGAAIWLGIRARSSALSNCGAGFFALFLFLRFFHWWWDWMPGYLFFLILGLVFIGLLILFRKVRTRAAEAATA